MALAIDTGSLLASHFALPLLTRRTLSLQIVNSDYFISESYLRRSLGTIIS